MVGSCQVLEVRGRRVRGRQYPWGVVEVENPEHCDFIKLRTMLITHMQDLQEVTQEMHYENFRSERLALGGDSKRAPYVLTLILATIPFSNLLIGSQLKCNPLLIPAYLHSVHVNVYNFLNLLFTAIKYVYL